MANRSFQRCPARRVLLVVTLGVLAAGGADGKVKLWDVRAKK